MDYKLCHHRQHNGNDAETEAFTKYNISIIFSSGDNQIELLSKAFKLRGLQSPEGKKSKIITITNFVITIIINKHYYNIITGHSAYIRSFSRI